MRARGFSTIELVASLLISALLFSAFYQLLSQSIGMRESTSAANETIHDLQFAMDRMVRTIAQSRRAMLPLNGAVRDVFAVTLPESADRDGDGVADGDNDGDGRIDEDPGHDINNDASPGIKDVDDDGDGSVDEHPTIWYSDDEDSDTSWDEDPLNGVDDDGDGLIDEDWPNDINGDGEPGVAGVDDDFDTGVDEGLAADDDEDGAADEDWLDLVVYRLQGTTLIERIPVPWDVTSDMLVTGQDYIEAGILYNVTQFEVRRIYGARYDLFEITLATTDANGETHVLNTTVRVGGQA